MLQAEGVADLMRGQLPRTGQDHLLHIRRNRFAFHIRRKQCLGNLVILPGAQAAQRNLTFDDFACTWIGNRFAVAPAARRAMHPLDHVVADVHRICAFRQHFNLEGILEAGSFKGSAPPVRAFNES